LERHRRRARHQLKIEPLCRFCLVRGVAVRAEVADHIEPHNGDWNSFRLGALQSLCKRCHDRDQSADRATRLFKRHRQRWFPSRCQSSVLRRGH
jgi:hypothetical protein